MTKLFLIPMVAASGLFLLHAILGHDPGHKSWEIPTDMARSWAYKSQSPNPHFANRRTDQEPVKGTIPRGTTPFHYTAAVRDFVRAGEELASPFSSEQRPDLSRGKLIFRRFCSACHGENGQGNGSVVQHGFPPPPSLLCGKALNMKDGHVFYIITNGFRKMPSYASQIDSEDRWQVIAYLRTLQAEHQVQ